MSRKTSRERLEACLAKIADPAGEGARAFIRLYAEQARRDAAAADARARDGQPLGPLDGAIVSIKDLFDVPGEPTTAGSKLRRDAPPATAWAPAIARLRAAGAVIIGKTNMSEFAFSGIGANPHYGTPGNPGDRARVPGGSTAGGAVATADSMCELTIGSDTGGSTRIPAALCGIAGFKPSQPRVPLEGAFPLSYSLDSIGPMAPGIAACALADAAMAGEAITLPDAAPLAGLRLGLVKGLLLDGMDATVSAAFDRALQRLQAAGARIIELGIDDLLKRMIETNAHGGFAPIEAYAIHRADLEARGDQFDQIVRRRIEGGKTASGADYVWMQRRRAGLIRAMDARLADLDAAILPTVPIVAPLKADVAEYDNFVRNNMLLLRNTAPGNFFDLCACSLPIPGSGPLATGLMLWARHGHDKRLFRIALSVETALAA